MIWFLYSKVEKNIGLYEPRDLHMWLKKLVK